CARRRTGFRWYFDVW
nr:immunoglobulin heavy chain junction region [Mus musculus]MBK4189666.1 immunoglobulin heavy chain junction region [Mus musculus]MBK4189668.1 immunoglobulin heavy chain junction region [Mus musculus]